MRVFPHKRWRFTGQQRKGRNHALFLSTASTRSRTFSYLFATLHVRWPPRIFNRTACNYEATTRWVLPPYWITILIDWWCNVGFSLFTWWFDSKFLLQQFVIGNWWIGTHVDYHPCITSDTTNQVRLHISGSTV